MSDTIPLIVPWYVVTPSLSINVATLLKANSPLWSNEIFNEYSLFAKLMIWADSTIASASIIVPSASLYWTILSVALGVAPKSIVIANLLSTLNPDCDANIVSSIGYFISASWPYSSLIKNLTESAVPFCLYKEPMFFNVNLAFCVSFKSRDGIKSFWK